MQETEAEDKVTFPRQRARDRRNICWSMRRAVCSMQQGPDTRQTRGIIKDTDEWGAAKFLSMEGAIVSEK